MLSEECRIPNYMCGQISGKSNICMEKCQVEAASWLWHGLGLRAGTQFGLPSLPVQCLTFCPRSSQLTPGEKHSQEREAHGLWP